MNWKIIDTGKASGKANMERDATFLKELQTTGQPLLHFYEFEKKCITYGHFLDPHKYLVEEVYQRLEIELAKRPTGGGIVFHLNDFTFSVFLPPQHPNFSGDTLKNYAFIHQIVAKVMKSNLKVVPTLFQQEAMNCDRKSHFCMAEPAPYDVMIAGKKVAGGAIRRKKQGFLYQGTICLKLPDTWTLQSIVNADIAKAMIEMSDSLIKQSEGRGQNTLEGIKTILKKNLIAEFTEQG